MSHINKDVTELFTKGRHDNISVILVLHNLFFKSDQLRTCALNSKYYVLFKNPRDGGQIRHLASQVYPLKPHFLVEAYQDATQPQFGYLFIDFYSDTPEHMRLRTDIFPNEQLSVYMPV